MLQHISLGQYIPSDSLIHGLDPRIKIITVVAMVMGVFAASFPLQLMALLVFSSVLIYMSGISGKYYLQALKPFIPIMVITLVAQMLFVGGREIFALGIIRITYEGLWAAAALGVRLVIILVMARLLTATTTPVAMTDGLEKMIKPLARIGFPTHELVMIMTISLRFIPLLLEEAVAIRRAQICRGVDYNQGSPIKRVYKLTSILVPLFRISFQRAADLALAMESRSYRGGEGRTHLYKLIISKKDVYYLTAVLTIIVLITQLL